MFGVLCPPQVIFDYIFVNKFSKNFKIWGFMPGNFLQKFPKFPKTFLIIFKVFILGNFYLIFAIKLVQNHYMDQNLAIFSHKT